LQGFIPYEYIIKCWQNEPERFIINSCHHNVGLNSSGISSSPRIVELEMVPHPDQPRPEITEMEYGMVRGSLRIKLRVATAGYILRQWSVDCSPGHSLRGYEFRLWLKDHLALYGVKNAVLAPGYRSPDQNKGEQ